MKKNKLFHFNISSGSMQVIEGYGDLAIANKKNAQGSDRHTSNSLK